MADPRKFDDRTAFFENAANNRKNIKPRVTERTRSNRALEIDRSRRADVGGALYDAAKAQQQVIISYTKITEDNATRIWTIEPYSYRYRYLTAGGKWKPPLYKKVLFGYDVTAGTIKMFMFQNILDVTVTGTTFTPQWEVQIQYARFEAGYGGRNR